MKREITIISVLCIFVLAVFSMIEGPALVTSIFSEQSMVAVIDAGHGGEDGGTTSVSGVLESGINLKIAKRLELLLAFCGIETYMTRENEQDLHTQGSTIRERKISDLKNRASAINRFESAVLVSIHQNHYPDDRYSGAQVFYAPTEHSKDLALQVKNALQRALDIPSFREVKPANSVYLMNNIRCTGILVECGFLSNYQEDQLLQSDAYQKKLACAISSAVIQHVRERENEYEI